MLCNDFTKKLLGLQEVNVTNVEALLPRKLTHTTETESQNAQK